MISGKFISLVCVLLALVVPPATVQAKVKASYTYAPQAEDDPGNEITQKDALLEASGQFYTADDKSSSYGAGVSIRSTTLKFDEPVIGDVDLLKLQVPITGLNKIFGDKLLNWAIAPGFHGEQGSLVGADFRIQGQAAVIFPKENNRQWIFGAAVGDQFGETMAFPIIGIIWTPSERSKLTAVVPLIRYDYKSTDTTTYNISVQPAGANWTWQKGAIGNTYEGNLILRGYRFTVGTDILIGEKAKLFMNAGIITGREIEIQRADKPSINGTLELKDAWVFELGVEFP